MGRHSEADMVKAELTALVQEIDTQISILNKAIESAAGIGARIFALHLQNNDVMIAAGRLTNFVGHEMHPAKEQLRIAKQVIEDYINLL